MRNPFTARRPWVSFLLSFFLGPYIGMLYLGRALLALGYFIAEIVLVAICLQIYPRWSSAMPFADFLTLANLPYALVGAVHAAYLAWKYPVAAPGRWYSRWYTVLGLPVAYILVLLFNRAFLFPFYYIPGHSMEPNFGVNDVVFASRQAYRFREPARGDVIVFHYRPDLVYIKRIIAVPGDRVRMRHGLVVLNGKLLPATAPAGICCQEESDGKAHLIAIRDKSPVDDTPEIAIPAGCYYVLGDNRSNSLDSRFGEFGLVARKNIIGPVVLKGFDGPAWRIVLERVR